MTSDVRGPIDAYLDAVDLALLKSGAPRGRRAGIVRDLESHIVDGIRERVGDGEPTMADVAAVLAGLDAPEAYRGGSSDVRPAESRVRRTVPAQLGWGAALMVTGWFGMLILLNAFGRHLRDEQEFLILMIASTPVVLMLVMGSVLGFAGYRRIRQQPEQHWGRFFAVVEIASFPFMLVCASPVLFFTMLFTGMLLFVVNRACDLRGMTSRFLRSV